MADINEVTYIGESLWPGILGHFLIILGFISAILAAYALIPGRHAVSDKISGTWQRIGSYSFYIHCFSVLSTIGLLIFLLINKYYEYNYVFEHANEYLPTKYIFSAFWEGQEGSFLLWMFWHVLLGVIVLRSKNILRFPAVGVLSILQAFLMSMLLGIYLGPETKIGSSPFLLVRDLFDAPIFSKADYVELLPAMAKGLNPLLQNYWNIIHPPTLFLGFATLAIPFSYAMAGLIRKEHRQWMQPALPWALFGGAILGLGLLMGSAWAYEALSFGGYWAWDPVENSSLVPWLLIIGGIHTHLIARNTGQSIRSTYIFYFLAFLMVIYSTTLTRSGVLGDTSVHAFTEMGLEWQLFGLLFFFVLFSFGYLVRFWNSIPQVEKEEPIQSREFWMFIGSLILLFSAFLINFTTSIPVYNKILDAAGGILNIEDMSQYYKSTPVDPIPHYNKFQIWIAVVISLLSGAAQFLRYKALNWDYRKAKFYRSMGIHLAIATILSILIMQWIEIRAWQYILLLFTASFTISANLDYIISFLKGNIRLGASVISHAGFGLMIIGILASGLNQSILTRNIDMLGSDLEDLKEEALVDNVFLTKKVPRNLPPYEMTYLSDTLIGHNRIYHVNLKKKNKQGEIKEEFDLYPSAVYDRNFTKVASTNPDIQRYFGHDIFALIFGLPPSQMGSEVSQRVEDSIQYTRYDVFMGKSIDLNQFQIRIMNITNQILQEDYQYEPGDIGVGLHIKVMTLDGAEFDLYPGLLLRNNLLYNYPGHVNELTTRIIIPDEMLEPLYMSNQEVSWDTLILKQEQTISSTFGEITFDQYNREPSRDRFNGQPQDIAVSARLSITRDNRIINLAPIYYIRDQGGFNIQSFDPESDLLARFIKLDPTTETITLLVGQKPLDSISIPLEIATEVPRDDYIVLQAKLFPGINLFWIGGFLMMVGLGLAMWRRIQHK